MVDRNALAGLPDWLVNALAPPSVLGARNPYTDNPVGTEQLNPLALTNPSPGVSPVVQSPGGYPVTASRLAGIQGIAQGIPDVMMGATTAPGASPAYRVITDLERKKFWNTNALDEAKFVLPDGRLLGGGDNAHEYIAYNLGYKKGDMGISQMMGDTGAVRINAAAALFDEGGDVTISSRPSDIQIRRLASYVNKRNTPTRIELGNDFVTVHNGAELKRTLNGYEWAPDTTTR